ncbi:GerW family sporulation protein [Methanobacterium sp.]|uniref:GerW family sporulation protein n=1 Tax=Methanobacterium sp. TaxID=2164 RepID=UPI003C76B0BF
MAGMEGDMSEMTDVIKTTVDELLKVLSTDNVIGETMEVEDKVIIPITKIGLMFGTGAGMGGMRDNKGKGAGAGGGAGISPLSVIVAFKGIEGPEGIHVMSIKGMGPLSKMATDIGHGVQKMVEKEGGPEGVMKKGMRMAKQGREQMGSQGSQGGKESEGVTPRGPGSEPRI